MYEVIKNIPANTELIVHYLPERPEEIFFMPAVHYLRNTLYRRTMDTILEGKLLDYIVIVIIITIIVAYIIPVVD